MKKSKPSKQAGNLTKRESNKGDYKGISIDSDYLQTLSNTTKKELRVNDRLNLFKDLYFSFAKDKALSMKQIRYKIEDEFIKAGFKLSDRTFARYKNIALTGFSAEQKKNEKRKALKRAQESKGALKPKDKPKNKKNSEPINLNELRKDIEKIFADKGAKVRAGRSKGSKKGGESRHKKFI